MGTGRLTTTAAIVVLGLVGCADDGGTQEPDDTAAEDAGEAGAEGPTVVVRDIAFQEETVSVQAGTPVTWENEDGVGHTVTSGTPDDATGVFDEELPAGEQVTITVDDPGTYAYWCKIHPNMTAELVVEPADG